MIKSFLLAGFAGLLAGCVNPVPSTHFSGTLGGQPFTFTGRKQTSVEGLHLALTQGTNTFTLRIDKLASKNDERVISRSYAGQLELEKARWQGISDTVGKGVEGAVKGFKGGASLPPAETVPGIVVR